MEELNKNQIVLLTLLVSFVTSIATGIVTASLLDQAPRAVTQTINRVVERTIEKVVPGEPKVSTVVKEVPVVVTEEQLIVDVINKASPGLVQISEASDTAPLGSGFLISDTGIVVSTDRILTSPATDSYTLMFNNGKKVTAHSLRTTINLGIILLKFDPTAMDGSKIHFLQLGDGDILPGQTVIGLGLSGNSQVTVSGGIVSNIFTDTASSTTYIKTNAVNDSNIGGPLLNTKGLVIGLNVNQGLALTVDMIKKTQAAIVQ